jgi:hypothetical protein
METTLNIHVNILKQITLTAESRGISRSAIIILLIQKVMADIADPHHIGRLVKYQCRCRPEEWHPFHIQVREDMYEYWQDLRKLCKMSVSLILAYAVQKYLQNMLQKNSTDNYRFNSYLIIKEIFDTVIVWKFIWGIPPNLEKLIN